MAGYSDIYSDLYSGSTLLPTLTIEVAFGSDPFATPQTWTKVTAYAEAFSTRSGRRSELDKFAAGTANVSLDNADRRFDPTHATGPYYPNVVPMRRVRITADHDAVNYPIFVGFIEDWPQSYALNGRVEPVDLTATDVLGALAGMEVPQPYIELDDEDAGVLDRGRVAGPTSVVAETAGPRLTKLLDAIGWPATERDIDTGVTVLPVGQPKGGALAASQIVEDTEAGRLFAGPNGDVVFRSRHAPFTRTEMATPQASISDDVAETDSAYSNLEPRYARDQIRNTVQIKMLDGEVEVSDATSIARYGRHTYSRTTLLTDPNEAKSFGEYVVSVYKDPFLRFEQVRIAAHANAEYLFPIVLDRKIGDRVTITRRPDTGAAIVVECHIEGIDHNVGNNGSWYTTWTLSPADTKNYLILDSATEGIVDTALVGY